MSGRLDLRRGAVVGLDPLEVQIEGEPAPRRAWADEHLLGPVAEGDEVLVNCASLDLGLGSGGFDVVHANLSRGLGEAEPGEDHVMVLNYTSLQHAAAPVEALVRLEPGGEGAGAAAAVRGSVPVGVLALHGHLAPAAWALAQAAPRARVGYVQTGGGALPGGLSRDVAELRGRGLLAGHVTAAPAYGGEHQALSTVGAIDAGVGALGWDAVLVGPGPGIIGSNTEFGHGGIAAVESAHAALGLSLPTVLAPRISSGDPRERHRGLSHHTATTLELLLRPVAIAMASGFPEIEAELEVVATTGGHRLHVVEVDLDGYAASGLPKVTMGRELTDDLAFFAAALAAGSLLARDSAA